MPDFASASPQLHSMQEDIHVSLSVGYAIQGKQKISFLFAERRYSVLPKWELCVSDCKTSNENI